MQPGDVVRLGEGLILCFKNRFRGVSDLTGVVTRIVSPTSVIVHWYSDQAKTPSITDAPDPLRKYSRDYLPSHLEIPDIEIVPGAASVFCCGYVSRRSGLFMLVSRLLKSAADAYVYTMGIYRDDIVMGSLKAFVRPSRQSSWAQIELPKLPLPYFEPFECQSPESEAAASHGDYE